MQHADIPLVDPGAALQAARASGRPALTEPEAKQILRAIGIRVPPGLVLTGPQPEQVSRSAQLRAPLAVKIISPDALHKSDSGGVVLNVSGLDAVGRAIVSIATRHAGCDIHGYLVEEMAAPGVELILGGAIDPVFGATIMVGAGGILAELLADVTVRVCPIDRAQAGRMLDGLRCAPLLEGYRGRAAVDRAALIDAMLALGGANGLLLRHAGQLASIDVNPLIACAHGVTAVDARVLLAADTVTQRHAEGAPVPAADLQRLYQPRAIAVVGASADGRGAGNTFIRNLKAFGYAGQVHAIHPSAAEVEGVPAVPSFAALPQPVDYAYIAIPAPAVAGLFAQAHGKVRFAQVMSSGFAETAEGAARQHTLVQAVRAAGARLVGPNCLGLHSVRGRVTFVDGVAPAAGGFGVVSQSGGMGVDILRRGQARGVRFASLLTLGNAADLSAAELLAHLLADADVTQIGLYLESVTDGRALYELLRANAGRKPVVLLKGGMSEQGQRAAQSHTGALASDERLWRGLAAQTGVILVDTLDAFLDTALMLQCLAPHAGRATGSVCLFGNGGGTSVIACDAFARCGLAVKPFPADTVARLDALQLPPGASVANPIDTPVGVLAKDGGRIAEQILRIAYDAPALDAVVLHLNLPVIVGFSDADLVRNLVQAALRARAQAGQPIHFVMVLRSDGSAEIDDMRRAFRAQALAAGIPVFDELPEAAAALARLRALELHRLRAADDSHSPETHKGATHGTQ